MSRVHPTVARKYILVRVDGDDVSTVRYERFADGSALAIADAGYVRLKGLDAKRYSSGTILNAEESDTAWQRLWSELAADGFIPLDTAKSAGLLPPAWAP